MNTETFHFKLGDFNCIAINDGYINSIPAHEFFAGAPLYDLQMAFERHDVAPGPLTIPAIILYIDTGHHRVLVDTGGGRHTDDPQVGHLVSRLRFEGINPEDIDTVVLSHGHWDHVGGNTQPNGTLTFPNARYVIDRKEYTYWITQETPAEIPTIYKNLTLIRERLDLLDHDAAIVPGIEAIHAPGHTLGHTAYRVTSGDAILYCLMDTVDHPIHFEYINWMSSWEMEPRKTAETRQALFERAYREGALVHGFHLPFPGLGHLSELGTAWRYEPIGIL